MGQGLPSGMKSRLSVGTGFFTRTILGAQMPLHRAPLLMGQGAEPLHLPHQSQSHLMQEAALHAELHPHAPLHLLYPEGDGCLHQRLHPLWQQRIRPLRGQITGEDLQLPCLSHRLLRGLCYPCSCSPSFLLSFQEWSNSFPSFLVALPISIPSPPQNLRSAPTQEQLSSLMASKLLPGQS